MEIGYVYLIKSIYGYKIGFTKTPKKRYNLFSVKLPFAIDIVRMVKCVDYKEVERKLHNFFSEKRLNGEWFALTEDDVKMFDTQIDDFKLKNKPHRKKENINKSIVSDRLEVLLSDVDKLVFPRHPFFKTPNAISDKVLKSAFRSISKNVSFSDNFDSKRYTGVNSKICGCVGLLLIYKPLLTSHPKKEFGEVWSNLKTYYPLLDELKIKTFDTWNIAVENSNLDHMYKAYYKPFKK